MKNTLYLCLFLGGCATFSNSQNDFYHRFAAKPSIVETDLGNGNKQETLKNSYDVTIVATIDCDNELVKRTVTVKNISYFSFNTHSDTSHNCSVIQWKTK